MNDASSSVREVTPEDIAVFERTRGVDAVVHDERSITRASKDVLADPRVSQATL